MVMKQMGWGCAVACILLAPLCADAAGSTAAAADSVPTTTTDACKATVLRFERALTLLRATQGNKAGEEMRERLLPAKLQAEILFKEGYCGLARYIQEKRLDR